MQTQPGLPARRQSTNHLHIPNRKHVDFDQSSPIAGGPSSGNLSPELAPNTPPVFPQQQPLTQQKPQQKEEEDTSSAYSGVCKIGSYILVRQIQTQGQIQHFTSFHVNTYEEFVCKVIPSEKFHDSIQPYYQVGSHDHINQIAEIIHGKTKAYVFFGQSYGDLHTYVRNKKRLRESEVCRLSQQILAAVECCHENGVILRDLKLRKFVFKDPEQTQLKLVGLEDAHILENDSDDSMIDKHGCPAYVSPEILNPNKSYSGKAADIWSVGVMLYTMLVGRYPFHDREPSTLFMKIRRGDFTIPDSLSSRAKCLLRSLLRKDPCERLNSSEVQAHPWFKSASRVFGSNSSSGSNLGNGGSNSGSGSSGKLAGLDLLRGQDQIVPSINVTQTEDFFV